jgi:isopenicillin N synthase-like dioxygenase
MGDSTATTGSQTANLPIIDFSKIEGLNSEATENAAEKQKLFQALRNVGFIYLKNYGISESKVQLLFEYATRFFSQPLSEKEKIESGESKFFRGWFSPERTSGDARIADQKEAFDIGDDGNPSRPNQWPVDWPEFRTDMNYFFEKCHDIHLVLLSTLAETVGLSRDSFLPYVQDKDHFFRLLHYPQTTLESFGSRLRASPHTDYGTFTLLFNDNSGGLQIRGKDGQWLDVHPIPGCAIVNSKHAYSLCISISLPRTIFCIGTN